MKMLTILEANPMLIKSQGRYLYPIPLVEFIILRNWGYIDNKKKLVRDFNWYESPTKTSITRIIGNYEILLDNILFFQF